VGALLADVLVEGHGGDDLHPGVLARACALSSGYLP
jgi:hypothetical protein